MLRVWRVHWSPGWASDVGQHYPLLDMLGQGGFLPELGSTGLLYMRINGMWRIQVPAAARKGKGQELSVSPVP